MIPATVPPFPFYIINKDIIKGSFPFRKTFHTPKPDFAPPISTASRVPPTRRAETEPRKRNKPEAKDALPAEARFRIPTSTAPRVPPTRRAGTEPRKRNKPEAKDALPAEARFRNLDFAPSISTAPSVPPT